MRDSFITDETPYDRANWDTLPPAPKSRAGSRPPSHAGSRAPSRRPQSHREPSVRAPSRLSKVELIPNDDLVELGNEELHYDGLGDAAEIASNEQDGLRSELGSHNGDAVHAAVRSPVIGFFCQTEPLPLRLTISMNLVLKMDQDPNTSLMVRHSATSVLQGKVSSGRLPQINPRLVMVLRIPIFVPNYRFSIIVAACSYTLTCSSSSPSPRIRMDVASQRSKSRELSFVRSWPKFDRTYISLVTTTSAKTRGHLRCLLLVQQMYTLTLKPLRIRAKQQADTLALPLASRIDRTQQHARLKPHRHLLLPFLHRAHIHIPIPILILMLLPLLALLSALVPMGQQPSMLYVFSSSNFWL